MNWSSKKIGLIGAGNMCKAIIKGFLDSKQLKPEQIYVSSRSQKRIDKLVDKFGVQSIQGNDELVAQADIVIICVKPQDYKEALEPCREVFADEHIIVSLVAGVEISDLKKCISEGTICRIMMNTPIFIGKGAIGCCSPSTYAQEQVESLFSCMGKVFQIEEGEQFDAFTVASSSGTGFIFELMSYWREWIQEHGIDEDVAHDIVMQTFLGSTLLAQSSNEKIEDLQRRVVSKKGVTAAGLQSMRSLEIEGLLRMSFNKSTVRNKELG